MKNIENKLKCLNFYCCLSQTVAAKKSNSITYEIPTIPGDMKGLVVNWNQQFLD